MNNALRGAIILGMVGLLAGGLWKSSQSNENAPAGGAPQASVPASSTSLQVVRLLTGSAKFGFLKDARVVDALAQEGLALELTKSGEFEVDVRRKAEVDAVWPAGSDAAQDFATAWGTPNTYSVFSTPLTIASWKPLLSVLENNGLAKRSGNHAEFNLEKALPLMLKGTRWNQLKDNATFDVNRGFLVNTPDIRKSNTSAAYIGELAYVLNNSEVPQSQAKAVELAEQLAPLLTRQGFQEGTLAGPFEDYLGQGMGKAPLVLIYESQFVEAKRDGKLNDSHVLLYPQPGYLLKHILVAHTPSGKKLGDVLARNATIQKIAAEYGFRTNDPALFATTAQRLKLDAPPLLNLAETPSSQVMAAMKNVIVKKVEGN